MGGVAIKNARRIFSQNGGGVDSSIITRIETLENNEKQVIYWTPVSSASGTITIPTGATIILDQFQGGADAFVSTIVNGQPSGVYPQTSGGVNVDVSSFDALGNYTLSGTPSSFDVALVYVLQIKEKDWSNLTDTQIVEVYAQPDLEERLLVPFTHSTGQNATNVADGLIYVWGIPGVAMTTILSVGIRSIREVGAPVTGKIVGCVLSIRMANLASSETSTLYFCNSTTNVQTQLSNTITHDGTTVSGGGGVYNKEWVITGLNIDVTAGDLCQSVIQQPNWTTNPTSVYYNITYLIIPA